MTGPMHPASGGEFALGRRVDDLLLHLRGLVLVRDLLAARGAGADEIDAHTREAERVRAQLAGLLAEAA